MSFTAADVVNAARDRHPAFDPKTAPDEVAYRFLQQFARSLASDIVQMRPESLGRTALVSTLPLASFSGGVALPSRLIVDEVTALHAGGASPTDDIPVELVHPAQRQRAAQQHTLAAYITGDTLQLGGNATLWSPYASVTVRYVPMPTVSGTASVLPFSDDAMTPCVLALADFFGQRRQGMADAPPANLWARDASETRAAYLDTLKRQGGVESMGIQDAYGDRGGW